MQNKIRVIAFVSVTLIALGLFYYIYVYGKESAIQTPQGISLDNSPSAINERNKKLQEDTGKTLGTAINPEPSPKEEVVNTQRPDLFVELISLQQSGDRLDFIASVTTEPKEGTCTLKLEKAGNNTVEKSIDLSKKSCKKEYLTINPANRGEWTATVIIRSGSVITSDTRNIIIK